MPSASAQLSLQCFFPSAGIQLQAGCAHLDVEFITAPFVERALRSKRNYSLENRVIALSEYPYSARQHIYPRPLLSIASVETTIWSVLLIMGKYWEVKLNGRLRCSRACTEENRTFWPPSGFLRGGVGNGKRPRITFGICLGRINQSHVEKLARLECPVPWLSKAKCAGAFRNFISAHKFGQSDRRGCSHEFSFSSCNFRNRHFRPLTGAGFAARTLPLPSFDQLITSQHVFWTKIEEW